MLDGLRERIQQGDFGFALTRAEDVLRGDPDAVDALLVVTEVKILQGETEAALAELAWIRERAPDHPHGYALRACAHVLPSCLYGDPHRDVAAAADDAQRAMRSGREPLAVIALSMLAHLQREEAQALRLANEAVTTAPGLASFLWRGVLRGSLELEDDAYLDLQEAEARAQDTVETRRPRVRALVLLAGIESMRRQDYRSARGRLEEALSLDPEYPDAHFYMGFLRHTGPDANLDQATHAYSQAIELRPTFADAYYFRAAAGFDRGGYQACLDDLAQAEVLRGEGRGWFDAVNLHYFRGRACYELKDWSAALEAFRSYLRLAVPGDPAYARSKRLVFQLERRLKRRHE